MDHQSFLGDDIGSIAGTKFRSMQSAAILGRQVHSEVETIYYEIAKERGCTAQSIDDVLSLSEQKEIENTASENGLAVYLQENLLLAMSALKYLGFDAEVDRLCASPLFTRLITIREQLVREFGLHILSSQAISTPLPG